MKKATYTSFAQEDIIRYERNKEYKGITIREFAQSISKNWSYGTGRQINIRCYNREDFASTAADVNGRKGQSIQRLAFHFGDEQDGAGDIGKSTGDVRFSLKDNITKSEVESFKEERADIFKRSLNYNAYKKFQIDYDFYSRYQNGIANKDNFYIESMAKFESVNRRPSRTPDYVSFDRRTGKISSEYWYDEKGVIRGSNHWGYGVSSCDWVLDNIYGSELYGRPSITNKKYGRCDWEDFVYKSYIAENVNGKNIIAGFKNVDGKYGISVDGSTYIYNYHDKQWINVTDYESVEGARYSLKGINDNDSDFLSFDNLDSAKVSTSILEQGFAAMKNSEVDKAKVRKIANQLLKEYGSKYSVTTFAENIEKLFAYMQTTEKASYDDMLRVMSEITYPVIEESTEVDASME